MSARSGFAAPIHRHCRANRNAQVAVFLTYAATRGHALTDRALYLPKSWTTDPDRCVQAGVPGGIVFATKPALAAAMIATAIGAGVPASWVVGDEAVQVAANRRITTQAGKFRIDEIIGDLPR